MGWVVNATPRSLYPRGQGPNRRHKLNSTIDEMLFNKAFNIAAVISVHF
jgi:hypothetical protein